MSDQNTSHIEQVVATAEPVWDPSKPTKRLAIFDEEGNSISLTSLSQRLDLVEQALNAPQ